MGAVALSSGANAAVRCYGPVVSVHTQMVGAVVVEVDENAHEVYDPQCELVRMNNITLSLDMPTKFIRYNPDKKGVKKAVKHAKLIETIKALQTEIVSIEPMYLFY